MIRRARLDRAIFLTAGLDTIARARSAGCNFCFRELALVDRGALRAERSHLVDTVRVVSIRRLAGRSARLLDPARGGCALSRGIPFGGAANQGKTLRRNRQP